MDLTQASTSGADPFHKPLVDEHPLVWSLQDVRKGRETDVSFCSHSHRVAGVWAVPLPASKPVLTAA